MNKNINIALTTALLIFAGCRDRTKSDDIDQRNGIERRAFEYLQTTVIESAEIDEIGLVNTLDTLNEIIARDFGPNDRFSYSVCGHNRALKDTNNVNAELFSNTNQFQKPPLIHLHIEKMRLLDILYEVARQANARLRIPTPILFEIDLDEIEK